MAIHAQPYQGPLVLDLTSLDGLLYDLPPRGRQRFRTEQPGFADVVAELKESIPGHADAAGISHDVYAEFIAANDAIQSLDEALAVVLKLAEVLTETRAKRDHERQNSVAIIVDSVRSMARRRGIPSLAAPFERTIRYTAQNGEKALKARRQRAADKAREQQQERAEAEAKAAARKAGHEAAMQERLAVQKAEYDAAFQAAVKAAAEQAIAVSNKSTSSSPTTHHSNTPLFEPRRVVMCSADSEFAARGPEHTSA